MSELIKYAEVLRLRYLFEIEKSFNTRDFLKKKFMNDQNNINKICNLIYKKQK